MTKKNTFTQNSYPKSYGNIKRDFYRLKKYLFLPENKLESIESKLWEFIYQKAKKISAKNEFKDYEFLNSGWEWSVFIKNENTLIKIPAGIFREVNDKKYLENTEFAYNKILEYFPNKYVAKTRFKRENNLNIMEQQYVSPETETKSAVILNRESTNKKILKQTEKFLNYSLEMLLDFHWLPDLDVKETNQGFHILNIVYNSDTFSPKIIDFTAYYDVYRLYPQRTKYEVKKKAKRIREVIKWINTQNAIF